MAKDDKQLSQKIATRLLAPAFAAFEAIEAGQVKRAQLETLDMTMKLARLAGQRGVRVPAASEDLATIVDDIAGAFETGDVVQLDDDQITRATQWLKAMRNQLGHARNSTLLALIDDLTLIATLQE
ncbi:hypothetical protein [Vogesella sp. LIG4]|uniref:hypothetical protein n=1 Tax=Vogesella sp. LIG4 TaxID=1192162 RepID=UPI00081F9566|nr:hypothetical protein [Vogesella sp. LIG4]SCK14444.1 hypothetical protein PSELUDRAFT_1393 [Vogesella sp. LIG4]